MRIELDESDIRKAIVEHLAGRFPGQAFDESTLEFTVVDADGEQVEEATIFLAVELGRPPEATS